VSEPSAGEPLPRLPVRPTTGHKGTFGTVLVLGGCRSDGRVMLGAPCLAARAAARAGAGLVVLAVPEPLAVAAVGLVPEATAISLPVDDGGRILASEAAALLDANLPRADCVVAGPGLGGGAAVQQVLVRLAAREDVPMVLDADALNALAAVPRFDADLRAPAILTPHPGEFDRLAGALGLEADPREPDRRPEAARMLAGRLGCVVALKGAGTVVSDGLSHWINDSGGPVLATGGTGDVLAGLIGGLVAQHAGTDAGVPGGSEGPAPLGLADLTRIAVRAHGLAADGWATGHGGPSRAAGMRPEELVDRLPAVLADLRGPA
jgi:NAD(P)H-hydrate epimerase